MSISRNLVTISAWLWVFFLVGVLPSGKAFQELPQNATESAEDSVKLTLAEQQYQKALELRSKPDVRPKQLAQAASLLKAAAGVRLQPNQFLSFEDPEPEVQDNMLLRDRAFVELLPGVEVAEDTHLGALWLLYDIYILGDEGLPFNPTVAFALLEYAASNGHREAQRELGLLYAIGIAPPHLDGEYEETFSFVDKDIQRGLVYLYHAATGNDSLAQMALGYRYSQGLGVVKSCSTAALYYGAAAESVIKGIESKEHSPFAFLKVDRIPLSAQRGLFKVSREQERLHYQWFADIGYVDAQRAIGRLLSQGTDDEIVQALKYFRKAAEAGDAEAQAYLGHSYANGAGVTQSNATALKWFKAGAQGGSPSAQFGLGYIYLHGHGEPKDYRLAYTYLKQAGEKGHAEAWFHLGMMHLNGWGVAISVVQAQSFFVLAAKAGHILAQYNLAITLLKSEQSCEMGLARLKDVAEAGPWVTMLEDASYQFSSGDYDLALLGYLKASELGYELAQVNAAWMISKGYGVPYSPSEHASGIGANTSSTAAKIGLIANQRAAQQGNVEAMLAMADTYYYGLGIPRDWSAAFRTYSAAASQGKSAQAYFNLGYMHQMGVGVSHDTALAKRNYDKAMEVQKSAALPVRLALLSLTAQSWAENTLPASWLAFLVPSSRENEHSHPAGSYLPRPAFNSGILETILNIGILDSESIWKLQYESWESAILVVLSLALAFVLFRRRQLRAGQLRGPRAPLNAQTAPTSSTNQAAPASPAMGIPTGSSSQAVEQASEFNATDGGSDSRHEATDGGSNSRDEGLTASTSLTRAGPQRTLSEPDPVITESSETQSAGPRHNDLADRGPAEVPAAKADPSSKNMVDEVASTEAEQGSQGLGNVMYEQEGSDGVLEQDSIGREDS